MCKVIGEIVSIMMSLKKVFVVARGTMGYQGCCHSRDGQWKLSLSISVFHAYKLLSQQI